MTAGEGCCGALTSGFRSFHQMIEDAVGISWCGHTLIMITEIVVQIGEDSFGYLIDTHCLVIEGGTCYGHEDEDDVIEEKRCCNDKRTTLKLLIAAEEIIEAYKGYERII